jgi:hypothetical protein
MCPLFPRRCTLTPESTGKATLKVDLRRDTITLPDERMREEAFRAPLGDSVHGEDPKQEELEEFAARRSRMRGRPHAERCEGT